MTERIVTIIMFPIALLIASIVEVVWWLLRGGRSGDS